MVSPLNLGHGPLAHSGMHALKLGRWEDVRRRGISCGGDNALEWIGGNTLATVAPGDTYHVVLAGMPL